MKEGIDGMNKIVRSKVAKIGTPPCGVYTRGKEKESIENHKWMWKWEAGSVY